MFDSLSDRLQGVFRSLRGETPHRADRRSGAARDPAGAARSGRQLQGRQGVHRPRARPGGRSGGPQEPDAGAAGRPHRARRDAGAVRRHARAGCRRRRRGRASSCCSASRARARRRPRASWGAGWRSRGEHPLLVSTDVRRPAAIEQLSVVGEAGGRAGPRSGGRDGSGASARRGALAEAQQQRLRRGDRRHRRPAAHRRRADGRAAGDQGRGAADGPAVRRRRDDRAGRDQERRRVQPADRRHRRRAHEDGRRRARRRGAVGRRRRRRADRVRRQRRAAAGSRAVPSRPRRVARARHGRRAVAHREGRGGGLAVEDAEKLEAQDPARTSSRSRTSAISCAPSRRWGRSSRSSACCPAWAT